MDLQSRTKNQQWCILKEVRFCPCLQNRSGIENHFQTCIRFILPILHLLPFNNSKAAETYWTYNLSLCEPGSLGTYCAETLAKNRQTFIVSAKFVLKRCKGLCDKVRKIAIHSRKNSLRLQFWSIFCCSSVLLYISSSSHNSLEIQMNEPGSLIQDLIFRQMENR